jgi:hypothetical protein
MNSECSISKNLVIERAPRRAYEQLARWHYRSSRLGPYSAIFGARHQGAARWAAVIVYSMPAINSRMRARVMANRGGDIPAGSTEERIKWLNENVRCISRVVVEPRYRGIGLAARLVRETLPLAGVPIVEALAVMGQVNPFFEKAGMTRFDCSASDFQPRLAHVLEMLGIARWQFIDPPAVHQQLERLSGELRLLAEAEIRLFMKPYVKVRNMPHSLERTRFFLSRLFARPVYYLWQRPEN